MKWQFLLPTILLLFSFGLFAYVFTQHTQPPIFHDLFIFSFIIQSFWGLLLTLLLISRYGGNTSTLGRAFISLALSFIFHISAYLVHYYFYQYRLPYPFLVTLLFFGLYISWTLTGYYFLKFTQAESSIRRWRQIIILQIMVSISGMLFSYLEPTSVLSQPIFYTVMATADLVLAIQVIFLMRHMKSFRGSALYLPIFYFYFGFGFESS